MQVVRLYLHSTPHTTDTAGSQLKIYKLDASEQSKPGREETCFPTELPGRRIYTTVRIFSLARARGAFSHATLKRKREKERVCNELFLSLSRLISSPSKFERRARREENKRSLSGEC